MNRRVASLCASGRARETLAALLVFCASATFAHHPVGAKFDEAKVTTLSGRVTAVDWANPHVHVFFNVKAADGSEANWATELASVVELDWSGWAADTIEPGDTITVNGPVALNGSRQIWGTTVQLDGKPVFTVAEATPEERSMMLTDPLAWVVPGSNSPSFALSTLVPSGLKVRWSGNEPTTTEPSKE